MPHSPNAQPRHTTSQSTTRRLSCTLFSLVALGFVACTASPASPASTSETDAGRDAGSLGADPAPTPDADVDARDAGGRPPEDILCEALATRARCDRGTYPCDEKPRCYFARNTERDALEVFAQCFGAPSCGGEDACMAKAGAVSGGQAARDYVATCMRKKAECGPGFDDDYCTTIIFAYKGGPVAAAACLAKSCAEQRDCFKSIEANVIASGCP